MTKSSRLSGERPKYRRQMFTHRRRRRGARTVLHILRHGRPGMMSGLKRPSPPSPSKRDCSSGSSSGSWGSSTVLESSKENRGNPIRVRQRLIQVSNSGEFRHVCKQMWFLVDKSASCNCCKNEFAVLAIPEAAAEPRAVLPATNFLPKMAADNKSCSALFSSVSANESSADCSALKKKFKLCNLLK